jgi:hypothetical protein
LAILPDSSTCYYSVLLLLPNDVHPSIVVALAFIKRNWFFLEAEESTPSPCPVWCDRTTIMQIVALEKKSIVSSNTAQYPD